MGGNNTAPFRLHPDAELIEIRNRDLYGEMKFSQGLYAIVPAKVTSQIISAFDIEKRREIKRVRRIDNDTNGIIISYTCDERPMIEARLRELGISAELEVCTLPLWCPYSDEQKQQCNEFWPMNDVLAAPELDIDPVLTHEPYLAQVIREKCVIIRSSDPKDTKIIATDSHSDCDHCDGHFDHGVIRALAAASQAVVSTGGYLCTGLDVYCYREPCIMCAMAMVHSRVGRLFYIERNPKFGGIESQKQVHSNPSLNHRYRAFRLG